MICSKPQLAAAIGKSGVFQNSDAGLSQTFAGIAGSVEKIGKERRRGLFASLNILVRQIEKYAGCVSNLDEVQHGGHHCFRGQFWQRHCSQDAQRPVHVSLDDFGSPSGPGSRGRVSITQDQSGDQIVTPRTSRLIGRILSLEPVLLPIAPLSSSFINRNSGGASYGEKTTYRLRPGCCGGMLDERPDVAVRSEKTGEKEAGPQKGQPSNLEDSAKHDDQAATVEAA